MGEIGGGQPVKEKNVGDCKKKKKWTASWMKKYKDWWRCW